MRYSTLSRRLLPALLSVACFAFTAVGSLHAGLVKYPADKPLVSVMMPDDWTSSTNKGRLTCASPDKNVFISMMVLPADEDGAAADYAKAFAEGAEIKEAVTKDAGGGDVDGGKISMATSTGKKDGESWMVVWSTLTLTKGSKVGIVVTGEVAATNDAKVKAILDTISAVK